MEIYIYRAVAHLDLSVLLEMVDLLTAHVVNLGLVCSPENVGFHPGYSYLTNLTGPQMRDLNLSSLGGGGPVPSQANAPPGSILDRP